MPGRDTVNSDFANSVIENVGNTFLQYVHRVGSNPTFQWHGTSKTDFAEKSETICVPLPTLLHADPVGGSRTEEEQQP